VREFGFCFIVFRFRREELSVWWFRRLQLGLVFVVVVVVVVVAGKKEREASKTELVWSWCLVFFSWG
jgi:hypothetical protein